MILGYIDHFFNSDKKYNNEFDDSPGFFGKILIHANTFKIEKNEKLTVNQKRNMIIFTSELTLFTLGIALKNSNGNDEEKKKSDLLARIMISQSQTLNPIFYVNKFASPFVVAKYLSNVTNAITNIFEGKPERAIRVTPLNPIYELSEDLIEN